MDTSFTPGTTAAVARVRRQSVGDLLHRTARRHPDKLAVVAGELRATYAEFDAAVNRCAHALADRGLAKGDRLALLSHNCWQFAVLTYATARQGVVLVPVNFMLGAEEIAFILAHSGARGMVVEDALVPTAEKALASAGVTGGIRGLIGLSGSDPVEGCAVEGWEDVDPWWREGPDSARDSAPDVEVADDDPLRLMYTSGTESRPKGVLLSSRSLIAQYVSCVVDGGMSADDIEVHSLPMYHCAQLDCFSRPRHLPGRDHDHPARPRRGDAAGDDRAGEGHQAVLPTDGVDLAAAPPRLRLHRPVVAAQGLLRGLADAGGGAARDPAAAARRGAVELLRADRDGAGRHDPRPAGAAGATRVSAGRPALNVETGDRRRRRPAGAAG